MPSFPDFLRFWLSPSAPFSPGSTVPPWFPDAASSDAKTGSDSDPLAIENVASPATAALSGSAFPPQFGMPTFPAAAPFPNVAPQISTGGILGGHPSVSPGVEVGTQPSGILGSLFDGLQLDSQPILGWPNSSFNLPTVDPIASSRLPALDPFVGSLLTNSTLSNPTPALSALSRPGAFVQVPRQAQPEVARDSSEMGSISPMPLSNPLSPQFPRQIAPLSLERGAVQTAGGNDFPVSARIYYPDVPDSSDASPDGAQPGQLNTGNGSDWSAYLQHAQYVLPSAITGNAQIDRTTKLLVDGLAESAKTKGQAVPPGMRSTVFGVHVHHDFGTRVKALDLPGIGQDGVEQSWSLKELVRYGLADSIRTDIYLRDRLGKPIAIYDLKTGNARLTSSRRQELRDAVGAGSIPVIELRLGDLTALQR